MKPYYEDDAVTIYHGDCRDILPTLTPVDLLLTDPPYGIGAPSHPFGIEPSAPVKRYTDEWDKKPVSHDLLDACRAVGKHQIIFGGNFFELPPSSCWLVWDKDNGSNPYADAELAWTNLEKAVRLTRWRWQGMLQQLGGDRKEQRIHPTQKPLAVMRWAIEQAPSDVKTILDPFMGSGTTLRAAKDLGRKAIGIEIEEKYCKIAAKRMAQSVMDLA